MTFARFDPLVDVEVLEEISPLEYEARRRASNSDELADTGFHRSVSFAGFKLKSLWTTAASAGQNLLFDFWFLSSSTLSAVFLHSTLPHNSGSARQDKNSPSGFCSSAVHNIDGTPLAPNGSGQCCGAGLRGLELQNYLISLIASANQGRFFVAASRYGVPPLV